MNIKETALKVWDSNMIECPPENLTKFAEALVAELANENKPFAWYDGNKFYANEESASMACADMANLKPVFTSPLNIADIPLDRSDVDRAKKVSQATPRIKSRGIGLRILPAVQRLYLSLRRGCVMDTSNFKEVFESPKVKTLTAQVAALELEVVRMREALETFMAEHEECEDSDGWMAQMCSMEALHVADEVMSSPFTPTALSAMVAKASEVMRQRAISAGSAINPIYGAGAAIDAIRALPNVTLEELLCEGS